MTDAQAALAAPDEAPAAPPRKAPKPFKTLNGQDLADFRRNYWFLVVADNSELADFLSPAMWVNCTGKLRQYDQIELVSPNGGFDVLLRVDAVSGGLPQFRVLRQNIVEAGAIGPGDHVAFHPQLGSWAAFAGGELLAEGLPDRAAAERALADFRGRP